MQLLQLGRKILALFFIFVVTLLLITPLNAVSAWNEGVKATATCEGWEISADPKNYNDNWYVWKPVAITGTGTGDWSNGSPQNYTVTITWRKFGKFTGHAYNDYHTEKKVGTVSKPTNCKEPQLNLSHIECTEKGVEVHFVLLHVADGITPGNVTYTYGTIAPGAHTGNVWHYTDYLPSGTYNIGSASVLVDGELVTLHNPGEYAGTYNCGQCVETVTCDNACRAQTTVLQGRCGPVSCPANAPEAQACPTECGIPASEVPNGQCGLTRCPATSKCPIMPPSMSSEVACGKIDLTFKNPTPWFFSFDYRVDNEAGTDDAYTAMQISNGPWAGLFFGQRFNTVDVPAGTNQTVNLTFGEDTGTHDVAYRLWRGAENDLYLDWVTKQVETNCKPDQEPEPTPTPEPTPSPTPDDGKSGHRSSLSHDNLQCPNTDFEAVMDVKKDGQGAKDVKVKFTFNGVTKEVTTNENGRAKVSFVIGSGTLTAEAEGYPSQALNIQAPDCGTSADPDNGRGGQVLGATTLAETGSQSTYAAIMMVASGLFLSVASYYGYNQTKKRD